MEALCSSVQHGRMEMNALEENGIIRIKVKIEQLAEIHIKRD